MSRIALFRAGAAAGVFAAGVAASLAVTPDGQSRPVECVIGDICLPAPLPTVTVPVPLPTETAPTQSSPATTEPSTTATPAPAQTQPAAPVEPQPKTQPGASLKSIHVSVTGRGAKRMLALTLTLARPSSVALHVPLRPRAVRTTFKLTAGRHVRKVKIPTRTRAGRYRLTLTVRSNDAGVQTHRRTVSVRR